MSETRIKEIKTIDDEVLNEVVDRILHTVRPEKIILFGSHAYREPSKHSDLDVLVIMNSHLPRYKRSAIIYRALAGLLIPKDVIVYTPEEIEEWSEVPQAFISTIVKRGRVIWDPSMDKKVCFN
jgi:predicted nucleotidyltransferase